MFFWKLIVIFSGKALRKENQMLDNLLYNGGLVSNASEKSIV